MAASVKPRARRRSVRPRDVLLRPKKKKVHIPLKKSCRAQKRRPRVRSFDLDLVHKIKPAKATRI